jgi:hypothetical protein
MPCGCLFFLNIAPEMRLYLHGCAFFYMDWNNISLPKPPGSAKMDAVVEMPMATTLGSLSLRSLLHGAIS